jgi:hypothetical protein
VVAPAAGFHVRSHVCLNCAISKSAAAAAAWCQVRLCPRRTMACCTRWW